MEYIAEFKITSFDREEVDGTYGKNEVSLVFRDMSYMEVESLHNLLSKGVDDVRQIEVTLIPQRETENDRSKLRCR